MNEPIILSQEFGGILDQLEKTSDHYFITGKAGTGKSTLLSVFRNTTKKRVVVLAPTGIAALNVKGQTIHSFFGFPPRLLNANEIEKKKYNNVFKKVEAIIIDEISMVRADIIDNINISLQVNRGNNMPFGGVQMLFFGDLFQLPPVVSTTFEKEYFRNHYESAYFFSAKIVQSIHLVMLELHHVYRQDERRFINLLDAIRMNSLDYDDVLDLNERHLNIPENKDYYITLCSRNDIANQINQREIEQIPFPTFEFKAYIEGEFNPQLFPTDFVLNLKREAQVMFIKNDINKQYVNGTIGKIKDLSEEHIIVSIPDSLSDEKLITIDKQDWEIIKYEQDKSDPSKISSKTIGLYRQYPLKLAWAITIHKSQGKTFDRVIIDLGQGAFESGQTYVALSRCRTLEGIILKNPLKPRDIIVDPKVIEYYEQIKYLS